MTEQTSIKPLYVSIWHDIHGLPRAYGSAPTMSMAERIADAEALKYQEGRPDVVWDERVTYLNRSDQRDEVVSRTKHNDALAARILADTLDDEALANRLSTLSDDLGFGASCGFSRHEKAAFVREAARRLRRV